MANMLKRDSEGGFSLVKFHCSEKESPQENKALEEEFLSFMELGITNIRKEGQVSLPLSFHLLFEVWEYFYVNQIAKYRIVLSLMHGEEITCFFNTGKTLIISAGGVEKTFLEDDIRQRHEETQKAKMMSMKGSGRFG